MLPVETPFKTYTGLDGKPLDNGYVYFGQPDEDPITHPVTVYWDAEGTLPAAQPLRTVNGYIMNAGTPANIFYDGAYSELVKDSKDRQVFYARTSTEFSISTVVQNFLTSIAGTLGASLIGFIQAGVGAVLRTVLAKLFEMPVSGRDFGAVPGITSDQSEKLQKAWDAAAAAGVPFLVDGEYWVALKDRLYADGLVRKVGLQVPSNSQCVFAPGAAIHTIPNNFDVGYTINAYLADNFQIIDPVVYGERDEHTGATGESQHCMNLVNCTNFNVHRPIVHDAWGDGIYIGTEYFGLTNKQTENGIVFEAQAYNCRRNNYSVTSGINIHLIRPLAVDAGAGSGVFPKAGIDLEPEGAGACPPVCSGWVIDGPVTKNCGGAGVNVYTDTLPVNSMADVSVLHHKDIGSAAGAVIQHNTKAVTGKVTFNSPEWVDNRANGLVLKTVTNGPRAYIIEPLIVNCASSQETFSGTFDSAVTIFRDAGEPPGPTMGNFSLTGLKVRDNRAVKKCSYALFSEDLANPFGAGMFSDAVIQVDEDSSINSNGVSLLLKVPDSTVKISHCNALLATLDIDLSNSVFNDNVYMTQEAPGNVTVQLSALRQPMRCMKLASTPYSLVIAPQPGGRIYPLTTAINKRIYSNDPGASVHLYPLGANDWIAELVSGNWLELP